VNLSRREIFSFSLARKMLHGVEGTPLEMDMRSTLDKIAGSLEGAFAVSLDALTEHMSVQAEDRVVIDPAVWEAMARAIERRDICGPTTGGSMARAAPTRSSPFTCSPTTATGMCSPAAGGATKPSRYRGSGKSALTEQRPPEGTTFAFLAPAHCARCLGCVVRFFWVDVPIDSDDKAALARGESWR